ncbi:MAG: amidase domain-containing protein [Eubacteriaceae bacterium]|nr:amidase domain-containing protein [Eubacteriaceae bacterium]
MKEILVMGLAIMVTVLLVPTYGFADVATAKEISKDAQSEFTNEVEEAQLTDKSIEQKFETSKEMDGLGNVKYHDAIEIYGDEYKLFPTFDNVNYSLNQITKRCTSILTDMQNRYSIGPFNSTTVQNYIIYFWRYIQELDDEGDFSQNKKDEILLFSNFIDIFENEDANNEIISLIGTLNNESLSYDYRVSAVEELTAMVPYNTGAREGIGILQESVDNITIEDNENALLLSTAIPSSATVESYVGNKKFNVTKGVAYADKYATSGNVNKYSACRNDCTNFTSQIKHEGGVPTYKKFSQDGAWTYKVIHNTVYPTLEYTPRWCNSNKFGTFFGVKSKYSAKSYGSKYKAFVNFAAAIKKGSFISIDGTGDGSWDHSGFVSHVFHKGDNSRKSISYHGYKYKDFKVAQHSKNYNRWASDSNNDWEVQGSSVVYAIIK